MRLKANPINPKTEFTRRCIGEAVIRLLKHNDFNKLKISEIAKVAGVSRTSFYQYYTTPYSVLKDYLGMIVSEYLIRNKEEYEQDIYFNYNHILFSFNFFDKYSDFFLTLSNQNLHSILLESINDFVLTHLKAERDVSIYILYAYAGTLLNCFLKWEENGKTDNIEDIAQTIASLTVIPFSNRLTT